MEILYKKYQSKVVKQNGVYGIVCGWADAHILLVLDKQLDCSFTIDDFGKKEYFIEERFKEEGKFYCYVDESQIIKYEKNVKNKAGILPT